MQKAEPIEIDVEEVEASDNDKKYNGGLETKTVFSDCFGGIWSSISVIQIAFFQISE